MKRKLAICALAAVVLAGCGTGVPEEMSEVPDVVGLDEEAAHSATMNARLSLTWIPEEVGESPVDQPEWVAVSQSPAPGTEVERMSEVVVHFEPLSPSDAPDDDPQGDLAAQVEAAFSDSYGWPDDEHWPDIGAFFEEGPNRVGVVSTLYPKGENEERAMGLCRAVASVGPSHGIDGLQKVHVTAGEGGKWLAECDVPQTTG